MSIRYALIACLLAAPSVHADGPITDVVVDLSQLHKWDRSHGDTWDPFWADDDNLYAFNDDGRGFGTTPRNLAFHKLVGGSVPELVGSLVNSMDEYGKSGQKEADGATWKACGQECVDGVFYAFVSRHVYGHESHDPEMRQTAFNASLIKSTDRGRTWSRSAAENYRRPMWPGGRFGAPYFIHYGRNGGKVSQDDADQYVYALSPNGFWNNGDSYVLGRVPRTKLPDLNPADWTYFAGAGPWVAELDRARPVLALKSRCGMTAPCFVPTLQTYLMVVWYHPNRLRRWFEPDEMTYDYYQSPHPWGPWTSVSSFSDRHIHQGHMYGPSLCTKFQERVGPDVRVWLFQSGCPFEDEPSGLYKMWAFPLVLKTTPAPPSVLINDDAAAARYTGTWTHVEAPKRFDHHHDVHATTQTGAAVEYAFSGTGIDYIAAKGAGLGSAAVVLDGQRKQTVSLALTNFPGLSRVVVFQARGLAPGRHVIRIVSEGNGPINVDAFRVYAAGTP